MTQSSASIQAADPRVPNASVMAAWLDNHVNPIVVKELRQAVRSTFIQSILLLFLVVQIITVMISAINFDEARENTGTATFMFLQGVLLFTIIFLVPGYVCVRLAAEHSGANVDLLFISTLKPRQVIAGKLLSGVVTSMLIGSVCAPFMTLTYLLRGIDLPSIFLVLAMDVIIAIAAVQMAIFVGSLRLGPVVLAIAGLSSLWASIPLFSLGIAGSYSMVRQGAGSALGTVSFWANAAVVVLMVLGGAGVLFCLAVASLTAPSANRATVPRIYLTGFWLVSIGIILTLGSYISSRDDVIMAWQGITFGVLTMAMLLAAGDRVEWGPRLRRQIPTNGPRRVLAFLLFSGSAGGVLWATILMALTLLVGLFAQSASRADDYNRAFLEYALLILAYILTPTVLYQPLLEGWMGRRALPAVCIALIAAGAIIPMLVVGFAAGFNHLGNDTGWLIINPFAVGAGSWNDSIHLWRLVVAGLWLALLAAPTYLWGMAQWKRFTHLPAVSPAEREAQLQRLTTVVPTPIEAATAATGPDSAPTPNAAAETAGTPADERPPTQTP